jgi:hypothetical protein
MAIRKITITDQRLPVGIYRFRISEMSEETDPKKGEDQFKCKFLTISVADGRPRTAWDRFPLWDEMIWKFGTFLISIGYIRAEDGSIDFDDAELVGKEGYFECTENTVEKNGKSRTFSNYRYLSPDDEKILDLSAEFEAPPVLQDNLMARLRATRKEAIN